MRWTALTRKLSHRAVLGAVLFIGLLAGPGSPAARAASFPPDLRFRTLRHGRIAVHYHQGLEAMARQAAALAEEILARHEAAFGHRVSGLQIVLADVDDEPNGFALPFPYPMVNLRAAAPRGNDELGNYEDWLRLVLTHELAHVVHLDQARGMVGTFRKVFGRAPFLFPNATSPPWLIEGLATYEETEDTAFGRGRSTDTRMVLRAAALDGSFPHEDQAITMLDRWPGGQAAYFFGEEFLRDLSRRWGGEALPALARAHAGRLIPYLDEWTARKVTGASYSTRWEAWRSDWIASAAAEAQALLGQGVTESRPLTTRGVRQVAPRFSPDGSWVAYTSRTLTRFGQIRLMRPDGSAERVLARRNGGTGLSWTPDGRALVFDEPDVYRLFASRFDLRVLDVRTGRVRRLTRGLRARDPDVAPDGRVVFVRRLADRSELATVPLSGGPSRDLTASPAGTQWSGPRWSPDGRRLVASRWTDGGNLDLALVDPEGGAVTVLSSDTARDVEPAWWPDGRHVLFRSDRDGISNLYALRLADGALLRVTRVVGGAFDPAPSPDGRQLLFADYSGRGYDLRAMDIDLGALAPPAAVEVSYPAPRPDPPAAVGADRPYRPGATLWPRFWMPFVESVADETRLGALTGGSDPLLRHVWALQLHRGFETGRPGGQLLYRYDRFRPTLLLSLQDEHEPRESGVVLHERELLLRADVPLQRSRRISQTLGLAWRRRRETLRGPEPERADLGGLEASWTLGTDQRYPYSISPVDGGRLRLAYVKEDPAFGSDVSLGKLIGEARLYRRLFREGDAVAARLAGGTTFGRPGFRRSFAVGGFPDGALFDLAGTNEGVLRGYAEDAFTGRHFVSASLEYRMPLAHPQRGWRSLPVFLRHLHAFVFADAAQAWSGRLAVRDLATGAGGGLGADLALAHALPVTWTLGLARGFDQKGETRVYLRAGLAF